MNQNHERQIEINWGHFLRLLGEGVHYLKEIAHELKPKFPIKGVFTQGDTTMPVTGTITGLLPGGTDTFFVTPVDVNGNADSLPLGSPIPTVVADDPTVTVATSADGLSAQVTAAAGATAGSSFNLNWAASYTNPAGTVVNITATCNVPILAPPALLPVGGVFSQGTAAAQAAATLQAALKKAAAVKK